MHTSVSGSIRVWIQTNTEREISLHRGGGKIKDYDRKAWASCPGPSNPTPGRQPAPRSSTRQEGSSSSSHRSRQQGRQSQGLRRLSALKSMGEKESKANVSTHPKYSASKDLHYICNIFKGMAVYVDWAAEMPE